MKKLSLTTLLIIITLGFSSCNSDETILDEPTAADLLRSFNLNKNAKGDFALNYELNKGASSENIKDNATNTNNIYLYSSEYESQSKVGQGLELENGKLQVSFNDTQKDKKHTITVLDNDIKSNRDSNEYLESYGVTGNGDDTYDLNFKVVDGISVDFIYDGDRNVYEVHLNEDASASQSDFVQTFTKEDGIALNIEFVNSSVSKSVAKNTEDDGNGGDNPNRPVIVVENEGD
ncbi:hypothetical protein AAON49_02480 [Pseudotenacibaculum sp. MALMAid0570]|mgnify:CR=1 FL=1|uniref:hypothetical protein n=1 Tax=Pseudotenacibaculum sp. MALMAid0570 TaxID=3143938 RepID=UPI0032DF1741